MFTPKPAYAVLISAVILFSASIANAQSSDMTVSGTVIDESNQTPVVGAKVELVNAYGGTGYFIAETDEEGHFAFSGVRPNLTYDLGVTAEGFVAYEMQGWQAPSNQRVVDFLIPLIRGSAIQGRVARSDGETPIQNAQVELRYVEGDFRMLEPNLTVYTDENGVFSFDRLPPNVFSLSISRSGYIAERLSAVRPQPGEDREYTIRLYQPGVISGIASVAVEGTPLSDMEIAARGASQEVGTTGVNGFFSIENLKPGTYQLRSQPAGFEAFESRQTFQIAEGETISGVTVELQPLPPALSVSLNRDVFTPDQDLVFNVRSFRIGLYECFVHKLPAELFTNTGVDVRALARNFDLTPFPTVLEWEQEVPFRNPFIWFDRELNAPDKLEPGAYILRLASPEDDAEARILFFVTDLGVIVKRGESKLFIYATNLSNSRPVQNAKILLRPRSEERLRWINIEPHLRRAALTPIQWNGQTDEQGILILDDETDGRLLDALAVSPEGHFALASSSRSSDAVTSDKKIFVYTDRPIYRPGHEMFFKAILRNDSEEGLRIPAGETVWARVINPQGDRVYEEPLIVNEWGSVNDSLALPIGAMTGTYRINIEMDRATGSMTFDVEEYRVPEFRVLIESEQPSYISGDVMRFAIRAEYYFGGPVPNARVRYRFYETVGASGSTSRFPASYNTFLTSGETATDNEGGARVEFAPRRSSQDRRITIEVEVEEASGRQVSMRETVPFGVGEFYIQARPARTHFAEDRPVILDVETRRHNGDPVSTEVLVQFEIEEWNDVRRSYVRPIRPQASMSIQTGEDGKGRVEWIPGPDLSGRIIATLTADDSRDNQIGASIEFWRVGPRSGTYSYRYPTLEGVLDKQSYQPGDEAEFLIHTNHPENPIILTLENRDVIDYQVIWPTAKTTRVSFPIKEEYAPNIFVGIFMPRGINFSERNYKVSVPVKRGEMRIALEPDKNLYKPGEEGTIRVRTTLPDGSPVSAEVSLAVVDEAIFALRSDRTPDIHNHFYGERPNWVVTTFSYPMRYLGGANKGLLAEVRRDFRDTALWLPNLYTDENGEAEASFKYPDNLTYWRLTARAHTQDTEVAAMRGETRVSKELVARLNLPRFFTEKDRLHLPASVNNLTDRNLPSIQSRMTVTGGAALASAAEQSLQAAAGAMARSLWEIDVTAEEREAVFTFTARGEEDSDGIELRAPVQFFGYAPQTRLAARLEETPQRHTFAIDQSVNRERSTFTLTLTPSPAAAVLAALPYLETFPYGCIEQTVNRFLPAMLAARALQSIGVRDSGLDEKLAATLHESLSRLNNYQSWDGGWGWYSQDGESTPHVTMLVAYALFRAQEYGYPVEEFRLERAKNFLRYSYQWDQTRNWETTATRLYLLGLMGIDDDHELSLNELLTQRDQLSDYALALGCLAFAERDSMERAEILADTLRERLVHIDHRNAAWEVTSPRLWEWNGAAAETTAWGLKALLAVDASPEETEPIVNWLLSQRLGERWRSTRETGLAIMALSRLIEAQHRELPIDGGEIQISVNGEVIYDETVPASEWAKPIRATLDSSIFHEGDNELLAVSDLPFAHLAFSASLFHAGEKPQPTASEWVAIARQYERAIHTRDYRGRPRILAERLSPTEPIAVGREMLVTLSIEAEEDLPYLVVEDPLPSGCEVIESFFQSYAYGWTPYVRRERRDNRMVFFIESLPKGKTEIHYLIRAELAGEFSVNPSHLWGMYYPEVEAYSASATMRIKP